LFFKPKTRIFFKREINPKSNIIINFLWYSLGFSLSKSQRILKIPIESLINQKIKAHPLYGYEFWQTLCDCYELIDIYYNNYYFRSKLGLNEK